MHVSIYSFSASSYIHDMNNAANANQTAAEEQRLKASLWKINHLPASTDSDAPRITAQQRTVSSVLCFYDAGRTTSAD